MNDTENQLILQVRHGDLTAFRELLLLYEHKVFHFCKNLLHDSHLAEDATQETFIAVYQNIHQYDLNRPFSTWLFAIAKHKAYRLTKQSTRIKTNPINEANEVTDLSINLEHHIIADEEKTELLTAIDQLKELQREVILMKYFADMSYKDIAKSLKISEKKVENLIYFAKKALHKRLLKKTEGMVYLYEH